MSGVVRAVRESERVFRVDTPSQARFLVEAGAYERAGEAAGPAPMELLLAALVTCAGSTLDGVLAKMRFTVSGLNIVAVSERAERVPRVYTRIELEFQIASEAPVDRLRHAIDVTERTCSASAMLSRATALSTRLVHVHRVDAAATRPLRQRTLRPHQTIEEMIEPGEDDPGSVWFAAERDGKVVGSLGLVPQPSPDVTEARMPFRLRAMATSEEMRNRGLGSLMIGAATAYARERGADLIWCSARTAAGEFYRRAGFVAMSEVYEVEHIGPHVRMVLRL